MSFGSFCITAVNVKILFHCMQSQDSVFPLVFGSFLKWEPLHKVCLIFLTWNREVFSSILWRIVTCIHFYSRNDEFVTVSLHVSFHFKERIPLYVKYCVSLYFRQCRPQKSNFRINKLWLLPYLWKLLIYLYIVVVSGETVLMCLVRCYFTYTCCW